MPRMIIEFNYAISLVAFLSCYSLSKKGELYRNATKFMFFFGCAALLGGFVHHMELKETFLNQLIAQINVKLPHYFEPIQLNLITTRLWYFTIEAIGFAEFYFMWLFMDPIIKDRHAFIKTYLRLALFVFVVVTTISSQYIFVVIFHIFSHVTIILFALYIYLSNKIKEMLILIALVIYNLVIGVIQQLMSTGLVSSGPLHYNDWYHIGVILFVIFLYFLFTKTSLIENLNKISVD